MEMSGMPSPVIIAMKGHPGTGKSTLAHAIAKTLRVPLIDKDDVRDCTAPLSATSSSHHLNDLAYQVIWRIAKTQLELGLSVVIDSPLSRPAQLHRLKQISGSCGARVFIVECVARDEAKWRERIEKRGKESWHKPTTWRDLERLIEGYGGCFEYDVGDVPKLVLDTTAGGVSFEELVSSVVRFIA